MALVAYRLRFPGGLHLGTGRADDLGDLDDLPRSDTIAAALVMMWCHVAPGVDLATIARDPPFAVSSALPTVEVAGKWETLFPMPLGLLDRLPREHPARRIRRGRFVSRPVLDALLAGQELPGSDLRTGCWLTATAAAKFQGGLWSRETRLRLAVNRLGDGPIEGLLYDFGEVRFGPDVRLTIVAHFRDATVRPAVEAALRLLGDEGLGADRSAGYGRFVVEAAEGFDVRLGRGMRLNLSLLHPSEAEIREGLLDRPATYDLVTRGGWVTTPGARSLRKRAVPMVAEGAVLHDLGRDTYGDSPEVLRPEPDLGLFHPVHRLGVAVTLPIVWDGDNRDSHV